MSLERGELCSIDVFLFTWAGPWTLTKHHEGKLVWFILRVKILRVKFPRIYIIFRVIDKMVKVDVDDPPLLDNNIGLRELVILGADSLVDSEKHFVPCIKIIMLGLIR